MAMTNAAPAKQPPPELISQLQMALKFQKEQNYSAADSAYKKALKDYPDFPDVAHMAAIFYLQIGKAKYAANILLRHQKNKRHDYGYFKLLGQAYLEQKDYERAFDFLNNANSLQSAEPEGQYFLGICCYRLGKVDIAINHFEIALENAEKLDNLLQIDLYKRAAECYLFFGKNEAAQNILEACLKKDLADYDILIRLAVAHGQGKDKQSLKHLYYLIEAIHLAPDADEAKSWLSQYYYADAKATFASDKAALAVYACLQGKNTNQQPLANLWTLNFFSREDKKTTVKALDAKSYDEFLEFFTPDTRNMFCEKYFVLGLKSIRASVPELETLYTHIRRYYLENLDKINATSDECALLGAMAEQCYLNEFVFSVTSEEKLILNEIKAELEKKAIFEQSDILKVIALACYTPLMEVNNYKNIFELENTSSTLKDVATIHLHEPLKERALSRSIQSISTVKDKTSQAVREQYEQNPYPRWKNPNRLRGFYVNYIDKKYMIKEDILIAGCGTGSHIFKALDKYPNGQIMGVDLSKASLSYAKRKLSEHDLDKKIELVHGDILELRKLNKTFDVIECSGVLHHMKDPAAGLNVLVQLLRPNGRMKLALYSTQARKSVLEARNYIHEKNIPPTPEGIRIAREHLKKTTADLTKWLDFFSLSECRDLMFHVQETTYTIPELKALLDDAGLKFKEFVNKELFIKDFTEKYPHLEDQSNLDLWHKFETENPQTFAGMYQFIAVRK